MARGWTITLTTELARANAPSTLPIGAIHRIDVLTETLCPRRLLGEAELPPGEVEGQSLLGVPSKVLRCPRPLRARL